MNASKKTEQSHQKDPVLRESNHYREIYANQIEMCIANEESFILFSQGFPPISGKDGFPELVHECRIRMGLPLLKELRKHLNKAADENDWDNQ